MRGLLLSLLLIFSFTLVIAHDKSKNHGKNPVVGKWYLQRIYRDKILFYDRKDSTVTIKYYISVERKENPNFSTEDSLRILAIKSKYRKFWISNFYNFFDNGKCEICDGDDPAVTQEEPYTIQLKNDTCYISVKDQSGTIKLVKGILIMESTPDLKLEMEFEKE
jgi:hypothetical protein